MAFVYSVLPEPIKPISRHFRIPDGMLDVSVSHIVLDRTGIMAIVGQLKTASVTEHVLVSVHKTDEFQPSVQSNFHD